MSRIIGASVLLLALTGCSINPSSDAKPMSRDQAVQAAAKTTGPSTVNCTTIGFDSDADGINDTFAAVSGYDEDGDLLPAPPTSWTNIYEGSVYVCGFDVPIGYVEIADDTEIGTDCGPTNPAVGAASVSAYTDADNDGLGTGSSTMVCGTGEGTGYSTVAGDCDDTNVAIGAAATWFHDWDEDGYGDPAMSVEECTAPEGYVADGTDCYDGDSGTSPAQGGSEEVEGCYRDSDGDGYGDDDPMMGVDAGTDCDDDTWATNPGATEQCNDVDDDCDTLVDDADDSTSTMFMSLFYEDMDSDTYGTGEPVLYCDMPEWGYSAVAGDCDDDTWAINPGATEVCDGDDNDCDESIDEGIVFVDYYVDADGDTYGTGTAMSECADPGDGYSDVAGDCNDGSAGINPSATDVAGNGIDEDCSGADTPVSDPDADGDGYPASTDCNDSSATVHPGATETCNSVDDDCDGSVDDGAMSTFYADTDGDGYGNVASSTVACAGSEGWVADATDCNDTDGDINPGETEIADNGMDDDCNGGVEVAGDGIDNDGDGVVEGEELCVDPISGVDTLSAEMYASNYTDDPNVLVTTGITGAGTICWTSDFTIGEQWKVNGPVNGGAFWWIERDQDNVTAVTFGGLASAGMSYFSWNNADGSPGGRDRVETVPAFPGE